MAHELLGDTMDLEGDKEGILTDATKINSNIASVCKEKYSHTCSNNHPRKLTTCLGQPTLSPPKQITIQLLLYKMITCLTGPVTTSFCLPDEKNLSKFYPVKKWETKIRQCLKNKCLSDYIYSIATI